MPGLSRIYVAGSVPAMAAKTAEPSLQLPSPSRGCRAASRRKLYSMPPLRCCSSVNPTLKSLLKSLLNEDAHGNVKPIRCLYPCNFSKGARDTAENATSWFSRWTTMPLKPSAIDEQDGHPAL